MTKRDLLEAAVRQSAADLHCSPADFFRSEPVIVRSVPDSRAKKYLQLPHDCCMVSYGRNIAASCTAECEEAAGTYLRQFPPAHCFEPPHLHVLQELLRPLGLGIRMTSEYWLPDLTRLTVQECAYEIRMLEQPDFAGLYLPEWSNALCEKRAELDVLGFGAYDGGKLVGLAACSADCAEMRQIGIDVLPAYRGQGIAPALTSRLAAEILRRGKVPFYCCAWCNLPSARNAVKSGFLPAWTELSAAPLSKIAADNAGT